MAKAVGNRNKQVAAKQEAEILTAVNELTFESLGQNLTGTQIELQQVLASLSAKMTEKLQILKDIEAAIKIKKDELAQLRDIEVKASTLDELDAQINQTRLIWEEEQVQKKRAFAEMQAERNKTWAREEEDYKYKVAMERRKAEDEFREKQATLEKTAREKQETLEKDWADRENELKKREQELADLRKFKEDAPEMIKKEANAAVAIATNSVKKEYETKAQLAAKDAEMAQKLATQEVASLQNNIQKLSTQVEDLKVQLDQARADVKEISSRALESASGRSAMEAMQRVMEKEPASKQSK